VIDEYKRAGISIYKREKREGNILLNKVDVPAVAKQTQDTLLVGHVVGWSRKSESPQEILS